jgi:hypothetical protein
MTSYDSKVIYKYAASLYSRAHLLVIGYTLAGVLVGCSLGKTYAAYDALTSSLPGLAAFGALTGIQVTPPSSSSGEWVFAGALTFGLLGFWNGTNKAFAMKLQAQTALCQVKIEENTKPVQT